MPCLCAGQACSHACGERCAPLDGGDSQFNIILFISIALVLISYFSMMAMVNMDVGSDSLLYSKSKSD